MLMPQTKQLAENKNTDGAGQYAAANPHQNRQPVLFQQVKLFIEGNRQADRSRGKQIADKPPALLVSLIVNSGQHQHAHHQKNRDKQRIKNPKLQLSF